MSFKSFLFVDPNAQPEAEKKSVEATVTKFPTETKGVTTFPTGNSFPTASNTPPVTTYVGVPANPFLDKILEVYDKKFNDLNQPGYDFFEFFKAVSKSGIDNPQVYEMALEMGQAMDSTVSKQLLLSQADFYIAKLTDVYNGFNSDGQAKNTDLLNKKNSETNDLTADLSNLNNQLQQIQSQIAEKQNALAQIDQKYQPQIEEVSLKLSANNSVKDRMINNISKVKTNILNNLK
jgi:hypothetical protein